MKSTGKQLLIFTAALVCLLVAFYSPWIIGQKSFYYGDITYFFEPFCKYIGAALGQGHLPLWNPNLYCGMPQIAITSPGIFYPFNCLFALLPFNQALAWSMVIHQTIAGVGGFLLIAGCGWGWIAAACCGIILSLNGYMFSVQSNYTLAATACWIPMCIWILNKFRVDSQSVKSWPHLSMLIIGTSIFAAMLLTAGRPEISGPGMIILAGFVIFCNIDLRKRDAESAALSAKVLWWQALSLVIGVLLSLPALLPAIEWLSLSPRASGFAAQEAFRWSANWYDLVSLFVEHPLGNLNILNNDLLAFVVGNRGFSPYLSSGFVGPIVLVLVVWALADRSWQKRVRIAISLVLGLMVILSLGSNTFVAPLLLKVLPVLGVCRYPVKLLFFVVLGIAILAARGMFRLAETPPYFGLLLKTWRMTLIFGAVLLISATAISLSHSVERIGGPVLLDLYFSLGRSLAVTGAFGLLSCFVVYLLNQGKIDSKLASYSVLALLSVCLYQSAFFYTNFPADKDYFLEKQFAVESIKQIVDSQIKPGSSNPSRLPRTLFLFSESLRCPKWYLTEHSDNQTLAHHLYARQLSMPDTNLDAGLPSTGGYVAAITGDYQSLMSTMYSVSGQLIAGGAPAVSSTGTMPADSPNKSLPLASFCQMTGTKFVATQVFDHYQISINNSKVESAPVPLPFLDPKLFELSLDDQKMNLRIYRVRSTMPHAYLIYDWRWWTAHQSAMQSLEKGMLAGYDSSRSTMLEHSSKGEDPQPPVTGDIKSAGDPQSKLEMMAYEPEHVSLSIETKKPCFLVLLDQYYPGWQAQLDAQRTSIYRANGVMRAVFVPAGSHLVNFDYKPDCLQNGIYLAALGGSILLCFSLVVGFWMLPK